MAVEDPTLHARRLGAYLGCTERDLDLALAKQSRHRAPTKRLGEFLLEQESISAADLASSIKAQRVDRLAMCPLFFGVPHKQLTMLAERFEEVSVPVGRTFVSQGQAEPYLYVLASGRLEVYLTDPEGHETLLTTLMPGEPIGEMAYFSHGVRSASVRAAEPAELLRTNYEELTGSFDNSAQLAHSFMDVVSERLRRTNERYQDNQQRLEAAQRSLKHLNEFLDLSEAAELGAGIEGLINRLVNTASNITDADRASLFLIDEINGELWSKVAEGAEVKEIRVPAGAGIVGWVANEKTILNIADAYEDSRFNREVDKKTGYRTRSILCAPIWSLQNEILGVVQVINKRSGVFNDDDESLLRAFAHQAAVAVENFNLYRKMMANHKRMAIMLDISNSISHTLDLSALVRSIVTKTTQVLRCDRSSFFVLDRDTSQLWSMEAHGSELKEIRLPASAGLAGYVATTGEVINIADAYDDARFNSSFDKQSGYRTRSVLCVPVFDRDGRVAGVTQAINKFDGVFDEDDVELLRAVSSQIGVTLENAKLHASTLQMKNYLQSVQESISNCIITLDDEFNMVTANKAAKEMFSSFNGEQPQRDFMSVLGEENSAIVRLIQNSHETNSALSGYELDLHRAGGFTNTVNLNVVPLAQAQTEAEGLVVVLEDITSEKRVKSAFSHYLAPAVIEQLLADPKRLSLGGEKRELTFLFTDIAGFTAFSERTEPTLVVARLNEYFDGMCEIVLDHGGTIDKIVGDALHVMFNAPTDQPDHAERAVRCALDLSAWIDGFMLRQVGQEAALGETRIGINTGPAVVGNFGGTIRFDYTAYGDTINTAARLEGANKYIGTRICVSQSVKQLCPDSIFRPVAQLLLKGKTEPIEVFEPLAHGSHAHKHIDAYLRAYALLESEDPSASTCFEQLARQFPDDRLVAYHAERVRNTRVTSHVTLVGK